MLELVELALLRRCKDHRTVLGANGVIGRGHAGPGIARGVGAVDVIENGGAGAELEHRTPVGAFDLLVLAAARAAHDRGDFGQRGGALRQLCRGEHRLATAAKPGFRERHHLDHALVGFPRAVSEGEDPVLEQDQAFDARIRIVDCRGLFGEPKSGHPVGHEAEPPVIDFAANRGAVRLIGEAEHRGRMGMVDEFLRQEGVQQGLDRRIRRHRIDEEGALDAHHVLIRESLA